VQVDAVPFSGIGSNVFGDVPPHDSRRVADHCLEAFRRLIGAGFLHEPEYCGEKDHQRYDDGGLDVLGEIGNQRQNRQQQAERIAVAMPQVQPPRRGFLMIHLIPTRWRIASASNSSNPLAWLFSLASRASGS